MLRPLHQQQQTAQEEQLLAGVNVPVFGFDSSEAKQGLCKGEVLLRLTYQQLITKDIALPWLAEYYSLHCQDNSNSVEAALCNLPEKHVLTLFIMLMLNYFRNTTNNKPWLLSQQMKVPVETVELWREFFRNIVPHISNPLVALSGTERELLLEGTDLSEDHCREILADYHSQFTQLTSCISSSVLSSHLLSLDETVHNIGNYVLSRAILDARMLSLVRCVSVAEYCFAFGIKLNTNFLHRL
jgi:hypothetical protein